MACSHLLEFQNNDGVSLLSIVLQYIDLTIKGTQHNSTLPPLCCFDCEDRQPRLHACLHCIYVGCWENGHIQNHWKEKEHVLGIDVFRRVFYCTICRDYVYSNLLDQLIQERNEGLPFVSSPPSNTIKENGKNEHQNSSSNNNNIHENGNNNLSKNNHNHTTSDAKENNHNDEKISKSFIPITIPPGILGMRGLANLGNTCFMNCILQAFVHNPIMRDYFLENNHNQFVCQRSKRETEVCLACEMDIIFQQVYSGKQNPFIPNHMLFSMWKFANSFAGYEQQDAHEFMMHALNGIHAHTGTTDNVCNCVVHQMFGGTLTSDLTCSSCGFTSSTHDPFFDISLDVPKNHLIKNAESNGDENGTEKSNTPTLLNCISAFTRAERLGQKEMSMCSKCNTKQESIKQLSIKSLPNILCFHLKRFEQSLNPRLSQKINTFVPFPVTLDMSPYLSTKNSPGDSLGGVMNQYQLFSVVNHIGKMDNGHYSSYVKHMENWFKCDDTLITKTTLSQVLESKGYLLFYAKTNMDFIRAQGTKRTPTIDPIIELPEKKIKKETSR
eukprot:TRINITY_DN3788_c0_g1_i1.p1 TRINITY_DN3788_c0_g1~~TRINITY_DN3788_c0_g1_i1.p1  ORF type:complete len:554 (-),score=96.55 TRINITY_DN3788_c0_g1_i1:248-1909(-)